MSKFITTVAAAALVMWAATSHAKADSHVTLQTGDGSSITSSCYHTVYGYTCRTWRNEPHNVGTIDNTEAPKNWAAKCNSCADLSNDSLRTEPK